MNKEEKFKDVMKSGKEFDWRDKKIRSLNYADILYNIDYLSKKYDRVLECASFMQFKKHVETGEQKLYKTFFCKSRLCALCNSRRSLKHYYQSAEVVKKVVSDNPNSRWLLLTLTVKNVYDGKELDQSLKDMSRAFNRLFKYKKVSKNLIGFLRATEVTVNQIDNSYNQHMHVLVAVRSTYFKNADNYIDQNEWSNLWQRALKVDYKPIVDIRAVKSNGSLNEVAKYPVKDIDFITHDLDKNIKRVSDLEKGLYKKRLVSYGGELKTAHKLLNLDDLEDGDLIKVADDQEYTSAEEYFIINVFWNSYKKDYFIKK